MSNELRLIEAVEAGNAKEVKRLLSLGADVHTGDDWALRVAAHQGRTDIVEILLDHGANVHANNDWALREAAYRGHKETVKLLLAHGANPLASNDEEDEAAATRRLMIVRMLIDRGWDVRVIGNALEEAEENGHTEIVELLRNHIETQQGDRL